MDWLFSAAYMLTRGVLRKHNPCGLGGRAASKVQECPSYFPNLPSLIPRIARESKRPSATNKREPSPYATKHAWPHTNNGPPSHCKLSGTYKELQMNTKRLTLAVTLTGLLLGLTAVASAQGFDYIADPPHVAVSPSTVIPDGVPYCNTSSGLQLICYGPSFLRKAYNFPSNLDGTGKRFSLWTPSAVLRLRPTSPSSTASSASRLRRPLRYSARKDVRHRAPITSCTARLVGVSRPA